ncbi:MAG: glycosyltransferase, partial [Candidatus Moranbacteria bacterium]|nr:glycosyltransferase [Candidatus Moranbacteria bacterium]
MNKLISIVLPVHNEEKNIPLIFAEIREVFKELSYDYEV